MRRRLAAAVLAVAALAAAGCARAPAATAPVVRIAVNGVAGGKNADTVAWLDAMQPLVERRLADQGRPGRFEVVEDGSSDESFKARVVLDLYGGTGADIYTFDSLWTAQMASAGLLLALDRRLDAWPDWTQYPLAMRAMGAYRGHTWLVPFQTDVRGLYYRKDLFRRAGLPVDWHPRDWDDIFAAGEALKKLPGVTPIQWDASRSFGEATTMQGFYMALLSAGGRLYDARTERWIADSSALRRTLAFYRALYVEKGLADVKLQLDPRGRERSFELFQEGRIGIYPEGTYLWSDVLCPGGAWGMPDRNQRVGWAPMPGGTAPGDPARVSISGGTAFILNPHSPHLARAWSALQALCSAAGQAARMRVSPFIPTRRDLLRDPTFRHDAELAREVTEALPVTHFRPGLPLYPRVSELVQRMTEQVIQGADPAAALADYRHGLSELVGPSHVETSREGGWHNAAPIPQPKGGESP